MAATTPTALPVIADNIPEPIRSRPQWVAWQFLERGGKWTKTPIDPHTGRYARVDTPATWGTLAEALDCRAARGLAGVGYVLTAEDGITAIDLDHVVEPTTGAVAPWAAAIVARIDSYTELSPSGTGLHILAGGSIPPGRHRKGQIEMYDRERYITITGQRPAGGAA